MRPVLDAEQMRAFDRCAIDAGVSGAILMENAGRGAAHLIGLKLRPRHAGKEPHTGSSVVGSCVRCADERSLSGASVLILCGTGNNGGDGFVVARHLAARAARVRVLISSDPHKLSGDAKAAYGAMNAVGISAEPLSSVDFSSALSEADVVVDALLGTGMDRPVSGDLAAVIRALNAADKFVVALDVPSGLDATRGAILGEAVRASHTVTFAHLKTGLLTSAGHERAGNITVSHIGIPSTLPPHIEPRAFLLEEQDARARLHERSPSAHKGNAGRIAVLAGSPGTLGAARLAAHSALRAGAGLVTVLNEQSVVHQLEFEVMEVMTHGFGPAGPGDAESALLSKSDAIVVGPGLGQSSTAHALVRMAISTGRPLVVDADALRYIATQGREIWQKVQPGPMAVLTPHPAEAAALLQISTAEVEGDRFAAVERLVEYFGATVLLKGSRPLMKTPGRAPLVSAFGSPVLATGGSGDVLCGILAAQLVGAQSPAEVFEQLMVAVALQGQAAELWEDEHGDRGLLASEVADLVPRIIARWQRP